MISSNGIGIWLSGWWRLRLLLCVGRRVLMVSCKWM